MTFQPVFVPGGVYLRTSTGELIGQLDNPGAPFASLDEAREHADWLEMVVEFQQERREFGLVSEVPSSLQKLRIPVRNDPQRAARSS